MPDSYNSERIAYLAQKWRDGTITHHEKLEFDQWYDAMDNDGKDYINTEIVKERIYQSIIQKEGIKPVRNLKVFRGKRILIALSAFLLLFFLSILWHQTYNKITSHTIKADVRIRKALLPDGSIIWLKPGATLSYPEVFGKTRNVTLTGEALFEVAKDKKHPFVITAGNYTATVLGTSFNLKKAENSNSNIELVVLTGKVRIAAKDEKSHFKPIDVLPAEKLETGASVLKTRVSSEDGRYYTTGTEYDMNFLNSPFSEVAERIEHKFCVKLQFNASQYAHCRFTANLTDQSLQHTLNLLTVALNATYKISQTQITIEEGGCE